MALTLTPDQFRADFPALASTTTYPDAQVNFWIELAAIRLNEARWGKLLQYGAELFVAHNLVLQARDIADVAAGGDPGEVTGPATAKSVDKVSVSYDAQSVALTDGGFWNMSSYGIQFLQLARMIGTGGIQL
ncbi:DUF4054 domain-containing protein [Frateuria aurantia]|uniref:Bacteriophage protein n=1 Tax=Frateuria aurantia (strain ATCC 33424 / DSM 6220 / KCTC 2777 / LMG 1558 / NBRC 3245 / NCIMB 13370) TaxID=767434 RepID=H8L670_FRAAD|nr:DUF4054 domain-containing protein [Frateuria aurantia]AFC85914.1 hypothetical protein Fraau_1493 [Frateuria aurantia DSM 6220]